MVLDGAMLLGLLKGNQQSEHYDFGWEWLRPGRECKIADPEALGVRGTGESS